MSFERCEFSRMVKHARMTWKKNDPSTGEDVLVECMRELDRCPNILASLEFLYSESQYSYAVRPVVKMIYQHFDNKFGIRENDRRASASPFFPPHVKK